MAAAQSKKNPVRAAAVADAKARKPTEDQLKVVRNKLREARDAEMELVNMGDAIKKKGEELNAIRSKDLPEIFQNLGIRNLGLSAEGNLPAYQADLKAFYKAGIPADTAKAEKAFAWFEKNKHGDLIKTQFTITLGRTDRKAAALVETFLKSKKISYDRKLTIPWNTLTAWLKEQIENKRKIPSLDLIGATIGQIVQLKPVKET